MKYLYDIVDSELELSQKLAHFELALQSGAILTKELLNYTENRYPNFINHPFLSIYASNFFDSNKKDTLFRLLVYSKNTKSRYINKLNELLDSNLNIDWDQNTNLTGILYCRDSNTIIKLLDKIVDLNMCSLANDLEYLGDNLSIMKYLSRREYEFSDKPMGLKCIYNYVKVGNKFSSNRFYEFIDKLSSFSVTNEIPLSKIKFLMRSSTDIEFLNIDDIDRLLVKQSYSFIKEELEFLRSKILANNNIDPTVFYTTQIMDDDKLLVYNYLDVKKLKINKIYRNLISKECIKVEQGNRVYRNQNIGFLKKLIRKFKETKPDKIITIYKKYRFSYVPVFEFIELLKRFQQPELEIVRILESGTSKYISKILIVVNDIGLTNQRYGYRYKIMLPKRIRNMKNILDGLKLINRSHFIYGYDQPQFKLDIVYKDIRIKKINEASERILFFVYYGKSEDFAMKSKYYELYQLSKDEDKGIILINDKSELIILGTDFNVSAEELENLCDQ